ncbi:MAG TPA: TonB-dependent receptor [Vicinamibacterales bacterium]|nr:TonB-dependent receptor [Vicinamibacterales bacterium]
MFARSLVLVSVFVLHATPLSAQSVDVVLTGGVSDESGGALPGATITATGAATGIVRSTLTDRNGRYLLLHLPAGVYDVRAELEGFSANIRRAQTVHVGTTISIDFALTLAGVSETVTVSGALAALEPTKNSLTRIVQRDEIDSLPVVNRSFNDLAALAPGVTKTGVYGGVDIGGSRDYQNAYQVDGVSAERQFVGDQRTKFAQDWIEEFQVLTSQFNVEFGQAAGGVLNVITRSGSNQATRRAYGFFRNDAWDARPAFAARKPPLDEQRIGGTASGPLGIGRTFYFGGIERLNSESSGVVSSSFTSANGTFPSREEQTLWLGKVEMFAKSSHTIRLRHNGLRQQIDGSAISGINTEEHGRFSKVRSSDVVGAWTWVVSPAQLNEVRAAWSTAAPRDGCNFASRNPPGTWFERAYPGAQFGCPVNFGAMKEEQFQFIDNRLWRRGAHDVKLGVNAAWTRSTGDFRNFRDGRYSFERDAAFTLDDPASYPFSFLMIAGPTRWNVSAWSAGIFVQDNWRLTDALTLNAGLRYDVDASLTALNPLVRVDRGMHTIDGDWNNVSPRAGFAWTPLRNERRTVVRGGAGMYYDQNHNNLAVALLLNNILVDGILTLNANSPLLNPFWPDIARAKSFLADALARNTIPDASALGSIAGATNDVSANLRIPATVQVSGGIVHQFRPWLNASADVVYTRGVDLYTIRNVNLDPATLQRVNLNYSSINSFENGGASRYRALQLQVNIAPSRAYVAKVAYTLAANRNNTNATLSTGAATNPFDSAEDEGPADNDVRHVLTVNGSSLLPLGIELSGIVSCRSGVPYSATTNAPRPDGLPFSFRPEPRNMRRGNSALAVDMRAAKIVRLGHRRSATAFVEMFNLTNHSSYGNYIGTVTSTRFTEPTTALPKRRVQVGVRVDF